MLSRIEALGQITRSLNQHSCIISPLGYITRELFSLTAEMRERCFYCMGSMGSVVPLALGVSLARPSVHVFAIEGDGSLLMNLGALVTLRRYSRGRITLFVFDNRCYESTGGQSSQPEDFKIEDVCRAAGLPTFVATEARDLEEFLKMRASSLETAAVLVVKVGLAPPAGRAEEEPGVIAERFSKWLGRI
jgi:Thiamine pyrophosphate-requiring enzymes [acetolactate synthase, pyruvate dehydrogenase (cytochrome), glyoxylate carboligase, phosphonopyruvate decarboxylase]